MCCPKKSIGHEKRLRRNVEDHGAKRRRVTLAKRRSESAAARACNLPLLDDEEGPAMVPRDPLANRSGLLCALR